MDLERSFKNEGGKEDIEYQFLREGCPCEERKEGKDDPRENQSNAIRDSKPARQHGYDARNE